MTETRDEAISLARSGAPLNARELMLILQIKPSWFYAQARAGKYDRLHTSVPIGSRLYSGTLVSRWLDGEPAHAFAARLSHR